jgi:hypothetical protein
MAAGSWVIPDLAKLNIASATNILAATAGNFRLALVSSAWTPNNATDEVWSVASGSEIANGNGYTTGGATPSTITLTQSGGVVTFKWPTGSPVIWTATGSGIPAWRRAVLYYLGTLNGKVNPIVGHCLGDSTPADVPLTTSGNTLTFTPNASGVLTIA